MYTTTVEEAVQVVTIITVILFIHSTPLVTLFDFGSTHTFIAKTFASRIRLSVEDLGYDLVGSTPARAVHTNDECVKGVVVVI